MSEMKPDKEKNFYEILNLKKDCKSGEIRKSFIELSKEYHPDKNMNSKYSHDKFLQICEAYNTLSNPLKRKKYDSYLSFGSQGTYDSSYAYGKGKNYAYGSSTQSHSNMSYSGNIILKLAFLPKAVMFATFVFITLLSAGYEFHFIRNEFKHRKVLLENKTIMSSLVIDHARKEAKIYCREEQAKRLEEGLLGQFDLTEILDEYIKETTTRTE